MHHCIHAVSKSAFCYDTCYSLTSVSLMFSTIILHMPSINLIIIKKLFWINIHKIWREKQLIGFQANHKIKPESAYWAVGNLIYFNIYFYFFPCSKTSEITC